MLATAPTNSPRPRTIPKNKIGEIMTTSQLSPRVFYGSQNAGPRATTLTTAVAARTPRAPPVRTPRPQEPAKVETTVTLITTGGNLMARLYRQLHELEVEWGGRLGKTQVQQMILRYHETIDSGVLVELEQFQNIIRGALDIEEDEKHTTRLFRLRAPRDTTMIDMSKMLLEIIGYSNCTLADKIELVFGALTSRRIAVQGDLFDSDIMVDRDVLIPALKYMSKVVDYYMQWADDIFQSIEGTPVSGQHARHTLIPLMLVEQCAKRQRLLEVTLMKCLGFSPHLSSIISLIQEQTNSLHKLVAKNMMSTMSGMQNSGLGGEDEAQFNANSLFSLFEFCCQKVQWTLESGTRAPGLDCDRFIALLTEYFNTKAGTMQDTISGEQAPMVVIGDPAEREATIAAREASMVVLFEKMDQLYGTGRLDIRDLFAQLSRSVDEARGMTPDQRLRFFWKLHTQIAKKQRCIDYVDAAGLIERGTLELAKHHDTLALWVSTSNMSSVEIACSSVLSHLASRPVTATSKTSASNSRRPSAAPTGSATGGAVEAALAGRADASSMVPSWEALLSNS